MVGALYINSLFSFSCSVLSDSLQLHGLQHTRLPCPSLSPGVCSKSCPLSQWCHPTISSFVASFSSCSQSFTASGSLLVSQHFSSGGQSTGASASASVLPMSIQDWFPLGLTWVLKFWEAKLGKVICEIREFKSTCKYRDLKSYAHAQEIHMLRKYLRGFLLLFSFILFLSFGFW